MARSDAPPPYAWLSGDEKYDTIEERFAPPSGYARTDTGPGGFGEWLRGLPLLEGRPPVLLHDGSQKSNQSAHAAVVNLDVGNRDLQQCADTVMRLRAEYQRQADRGADICFRFTNGSKADWKDWSRGLRPQVSGNKVTWSARAKADYSYGSFKKYLQKVFQYAGTASLERELTLVPPDQVVEIGDVFIQGGFPGHAVIVVDTAQNSAGHTIFLIAQSYMPAQQLHVLSNPASPSGEPWYEYAPGESLPTPEWTFPPQSLRRFRSRGCAAL